MGSIDYCQNPTLEDAWLNPTVSIQDAQRIMYEPAFRAVESAGYDRADVYGAVVAQSELDIDPVINEAAAEVIFRRHLAEHPVGLIETMTRLTLYKELATLMTASTTRGAEALNG